MTLISLEILFLFPIVGIIIELWKNFILSEELTKIGLGDVDIESDEGRLRFNASVKIIEDMLSLSQCSIKRGFFADIASLIMGIAVLESFPQIGSTLAMIGVLSLGARVCIEIWSVKLNSDLINQMPEKEGYKFARFYR